MRVRVLLHHVLEREALQHAVHGRALQAGAAGEIEQARPAAVVRGDLAQQQQRALYALGAGQAGVGVSSDFRGIGVSSK